MTRFKDNDGKITKGLLGPFDDETKIGRVLSS
jgi:hypothetical protein